MNTVNVPLAGVELRVSGIQTVIKDGVEVLWENRQVQCGDGSTMPPTEVATNCLLDEPLGAFGVQIYRIPLVAAKDQNSQRSTQDVTKLPMNLIQNSGFEQNSAVAMPDLCVLGLPAQSNEISVHVATFAT